MRERLFATLFLVAFFAALPAWFLSTCEGWILIDCARTDESAALDCTVRERFAFSTRSATYPTSGAHIKRLTLRSRSGRSTTYQLVLRTPAGEREVLRSRTGDAAIEQIAAELDAAARSRAARFHAELSPDPVFWLAVVLLGVFAGAGLFIAWAADSAPARGRPR